HLFKQIRSPDQVIIVLLFSACAQLGTHDALNTVREVASNIPKLFHSNPRLSASLFDELIKCGDCSNAEILYSKMKKTVMSYGNLMHGFNQENRPDKTLFLFDQMKIYSLEPESIIYLDVLKALSQMGIFTISQTIVKQMPKSLLENVQIQNALIDMWASRNKCHS
ncbi:Pentatricopeptide repeat-containing protein, partial [Dictyocoela muelleri]